MVDQEWHIWLVQGGYRQEWRCPTAAWHSRQRHRGIIIRTSGELFTRNFGVGWRLTARLRLGPGSRILRWSIFLFSGMLRATFRPGHIVDTGQAQLESIESCLVVIPLSRLVLVPLCGTFDLVIIGLRFVGGRLLTSSLGSHGFPFE